MSAPADTTITSSELRDRRDAVRILDVRTPGEFESSHIEGSYNVPLDVLREQHADVIKRLEDDHPSDVVLVCRSGQRASKAEEILRSGGLDNGRVLRGGISDWESNGYEVDRGEQRWELERQVRLVAGSIVLSSVIGSVAVPKLKWVAAAIGGGLTYAAVSNTCAMASLLSKLPYNKGAAGNGDGDELVSKLGS